MTITFYKRKKSKVVRSFKINLLLLLLKADEDEGRKLVRRLKKDFFKKVNYKGVKYEKRNLTRKEKGLQQRYQFIQS